MKERRKKDLELGKEGKESVVLAVVLYSVGIRKRR